MRATQPQHDGVFLRDAAYSFEALRDRGLGSAMLRQMQRDGLKARKVGKLKFVLGADLVDHIASLPVEKIGGQQ